MGPLGTTQRLTGNVLRSWGQPPRPLQTSKDSRAVYRDAKHRLSGRRARGQRGLHKNHADAVRGRTLVRALSIEGISKSEVSRICSALDAEVRAFRSRPRQHLGCATGERHEVDDVVSTGDLLEALRDASR